MIPQVSINNETEKIRGYEENIPGTQSIYADENMIKQMYGEHHEIKKDGKVVLIPQPSDSPNDPLNWPSLRKYGQLFVLIIMTGLYSSTSSAAEDGMLNELKIINQIQNDASGVLFLGIGYFCFLISPSAFLYGRKLSYVFFMTASLISGICFANIRSSLHLLISQLFTGIAAAAAEAQVQLSIADLFYTHQQGIAVSLYVFATSIGTYSGPLIGPYIAESTKSDSQTHNFYSGCRWLGWAIAIISGILLVVLISGLEETYFDRENYVKKWEGLVMSNSVQNVEKKKKSAIEITVVECDEIKHIEPPNCYFKRMALITKASNLKGI